MLFKMLPHYAPHFTTKCAKFRYRVLAPTFSYSYCYYFNYLVTYYCSYYYYAAYYVTYYFYTFYYSKLCHTPFVSPRFQSLPPDYQPYCVNYSRHPLSSP